MSNANTVVTRFAPSPTGYLHVGGARTALFSWLLARHVGGRFLLRIEDTDLARSTEQATVQLLEDLRWLGLIWDNEQLVYQSKRLDVYNKIIDGLMSRGLAYKAYETPQELDAMRKDAEKHKRSFIYRRPQLSEDQLKQYQAENRPHVVRFAMPVKDYSFDDQILGKIDLPANQTQDFVIRKADGMPTYHFAVVVDDAEMGVTHVVRGQEHTLNTFLHIALQDALAYSRPVYAHLPVILNKDDGKKMGKRDRDKKVRLAARTWLQKNGGTFEQLISKIVHELNKIPGAAVWFGDPEVKLAQWWDDSGKQVPPIVQKTIMQIVGLKESDLPEILVHDFRKNGYFPEALLNFIALLGWNPGGDRERMTIDELVKLFTLEGVNKSGAKFDRDKLLAFNTEAAANATPQRLVKAMRDYLGVNPDSPLNQASDEQLGAILKMKAGFRTLRDVDESSRFLFTPDEQIVYDPQAVEKVLRKQNGTQVLQEVLPILRDVSSWTHDALEKSIQGYCEQKQLGLGKVAQPIRVAVSGGTISPPIFNSLEFLGREKTVARIERCLKSV